MKNKTLTRAEEQVMQYLWSLGKGFLKDIVEQFPNPKPAYTTVSTVIRVLVKKKFIGFKTYGKVNEYYPLMPKQTYFNSQVKPIISNYFGGSSATFASYFANEQLSLTELEEMKDLIEDRIKKMKTKKK
jgi:BlaI family transcriptional regulator, penicillinase repressor